MTDLASPSPARGRGSREARGEGASTGAAGASRREPSPRPTHALDPLPQGRERGVTRPLIVSCACQWIGTPYLHQASAKGQGTDCLGLLRGLYAELYGAEPEAPPPYTPDWNEMRSAEEPLLSAARRHLVEVSAAGAADPHPKLSSKVSASPQGGGEERTAPLHLPLAGRSKPRSGFGRGSNVRPGQVLIFRVLTTGPAKHCGVAVGEDRFVHAYAGRCVIESWLTRWWMERLAGVFEFPGVEG